VLVVFSGVAREMADSDKSGTYATSTESASETLEKLGRKVANEVRYRVRRFTHAEPLTGAWLELLEPLKFLASVAEKEDDHSTATTTASTTTPAKETTVWERDEVCVRIIVEEGKINLMARCLREIKELQYRGAIPLEMAAHARAYEESLGCILRCGLVAIECLQTLDLRSLLEHCANCLVHALAGEGSPPTPSDNSVQEVLCVRYLALIFTRVERLQPDVLVDKVLELGLVNLTLRHLAKFKTIADPPTFEAYLLFFVHLVDTEVFRTKPQAFFPTKEDKKAFATTFDPVVAAYIAGNAERKKMIRPLSDLVLRWK
jgi:hypothetical protein